VSNTRNKNSKGLRRVSVQKREVQLPKEFRPRIQPEHQSQLQNLPTKQASQERLVRMGV